MVVSTTPRIVLRPFTVDDADPMMAVFGDAEVMRFGRGPQSIEWVRTRIERQIDNYKQLGFGHWAIELKDSQEVIGFCGLSRFADINGRPEIEVGYRLAKAYWGQGYATEAATAVRDLAFEQLNIERLIALVDPNNHRSIRVAEKLGMTHTDDVVLPGYSHADRVYSLTHIPFDTSQ